MRHTLSLVFIALSTAACASGAGIRPDDGGVRDSATQDAVTDMHQPPFCDLEVLPVAGGDFYSAPPQYGPEQKIRIQATSHGYASSATRAYVWIVTFADESPVGVTFPQSGSTDIVEFPLAQAGSYIIDVQVPDSTPLCARRVVFTTTPPPGATRTTYQVRLVPPPSSGYPPQAQTQQIVGGMPTAGNELILQPGLDITVHVDDPEGTELEAYVRLTRRDTGDVFEARSYRLGASLKVPDAYYDALVVPGGESEDSFAPLVLENLRAAQLDGKRFVVTPGVEVEGDLLAAAGTGSAAPVSGARVVLRSDSSPGQVPSTVAVSNEDGHFKLHARPGTWSLAITPPDGRGLPQVVMPESAGLELESAATWLPLKLEWATATPTPLSVKVLGTTGGTLKGARVVLEAAESSLNGAGTLTLPGGVTRLLGGRMRAEAITGEDGTVALSGLPAAVYHATLSPPDSVTPDAVTSKTGLDLTAGAAAFTVAMQSKVKLTGTVATSEARGARVLAVDEAAGLSYPVYSAVVDVADAFALAVNPARRYSVVVMPISHRLVGRVVLGPVAVTNVDVRLDQPVSVPAGVLYSGVVHAAGQSAVPGTTVRLFCVSCSTPDQIVAETVSREDGSFSLTVPDTVSSGSGGALP